jgi:hypothetical protein
VTNDTVVVHGNMGGLAIETVGYHAGSRTVTLGPARAFHAGEVLRVSATSGISSTGGAGLTPYGWQFTAGPVRDRRFTGFTDIGASLAGVEGSSVAWGDYDNDGDLDILLAGEAFGAIHVSKVYRNDGGAFTDVAAGLLGVDDGSAAWGDYDNDGDLDILITGEGNVSQVSEVYRNDGTSGFAAISAGLEPVEFSSAVWGDVDNDGDLDILLAGAAGGTMVSKVYRNDGAGVFTHIGASLTGVIHCAVAWGDVDNDGDLDILLSGTDGSNPLAQVYRNDGAGTFSDIGAGLTGVALSAVAWGDYDNDGDLDILLTGATGTTYVSEVWRNDAGAFTDIGAGLIGVAGGSVAWGDYDNDGDLDILLVGTGYPATPASIVYRNDGAGAFTDINAGLTSVVNGSAAWGDAEGDGDLDILLTGDSLSTRIAEVYRNGSRPELGTVAPASGSGPVGVTTYFTTTWSDPDGWQDLKQCYFHIGDSPTLAGNVTLLYNAVKNKLWLLDDSGTTWLGGFAPGDVVYFFNSQAGLDYMNTTVQHSGETLSVTWAIDFKSGFEGAKKLGLKCKDRDKAKAKGRWKGTWTITE